jgi:hypothetical protein
MNLYLKIKDLLTENKLYRNSYSELRWRIWEDEGSVVNNAMTKTQYLEATDAETIRRTCQKVTENHPELKADESVREKRNELEKTGGNFVFHNSKKQYSREWLSDAMSVLKMKWSSRTDRIGEEYEKDRATYKRYESMLLENQMKPTEDAIKKFEKELLGI